MKLFTIFPQESVLDHSKKLNVKFGVDPTADRMHLGHLMPLRTVKWMIEQGHHIDIVLGTFTAQLGDPSGKDTMRPILDQDTTIKNAARIVEQINRILGKENFTLHCNHTWFETMSAIEMVNILSKFNVGHLLERDSFQKRIEIENPIGMHELVVPILQGFDSVKLRSDVEIGGSDQLFNFAITRDLQKVFEQKPEICLLMPIINGTDGRKMSKSFGNCIFLDDKPIDVFGKTMSISDAMMEQWFKLFFDRPLDLSKPMLEKKALAFEITKHVWSEKDAHDALTHFESVIQNKNKPVDMLEITDTEIVKVIVKLRKCSVSEARRLLKQGAVKVNDKTISEEDVVTNVGDVVKVGKLNFAKIV